MRCLFTLSTLLLLNALYLASSSIESTVVRADAPQLQKVAAKPQHMKNFAVKRDAIYPPPSASRPQQGHSPRPSSTPSVSSNQHTAEESDDDTAGSRIFATHSRKNFHPKRVKVFHESSDIGDDISFGSDRMRHEEAIRIMLNDDGDLEDVSTADFSLEPDTLGVTNVDTSPNAEPETVIVETGGGVDTVYETLYSTLYATQTNEAPAQPAVATVQVVQEAGKKAPCTRKKTNGAATDAGVQVPVTSTATKKAPCTKKRPPVTSVPTWSTQIAPAQNQATSTAPPAPVTSTRTRPRVTSTVSVDEMATSTAMVNLPPVTTTLSTVTETSTLSKAPCTKKKTASSSQPVASSSSSSSSTTSSASQAPQPSNASGSSGDTIPIIDPTTSTSSASASQTDSASSNTAGSSSSSLTSDQQLALQKQNDARAQVGVAPMTWSDALVQVAKGWADTLESQSCAFYHSGNHLYGENIAQGTQDLAGAIDLFLTEKANYSGQSIGQGNFGSYGHYTQIVWRSTTEVGCYYESKCKTTVCNYSPPGNYVGQTPY